MFEAMVSSDINSKYMLTYIKLVLWEPTHGHRGRGRPKTTYIDTLKRDTGAFKASEIVVLMADKRLRKDLVVARLRTTK